MAPIDSFVYPEGATLYTKGEPADWVHSLRTGVVKLVEAYNGGAPRIVRLIGPGAAIGIEGLAQRSGYNETAVAVTDVQACRIPMAYITDLAREEEQLSTRLLTVWQQHLERADQTIVEFSTGPARSRILRILRALVALHQATPDWDGNIQPLSVDDFSALAGISRESASRTLASLKREQVIRRVAPRRYRVDAKKLEMSVSALH
jgi:CRP-like cAMP-binding protein